MHFVHLTEFSLHWKTDVRVFVKLDLVCIGMASGCLVVVKLNLVCIGMALWRLVVVKLNSVCIDQ